MGKSEKSKVWLVSLESDGLSPTIEKVTDKQLLFEYESGKPLVLPVGYVIEHPKDSSNIWEDYGDGFGRPTNIVSRPIYTGVNISRLEGELLTIIDASFSDKEQCKAIKDLIRQTLWKFNHSQEKKVKAIFESIK